LQFVDIVKIQVKAGDGGDGAVSFHREKYVASGGPDGGNGGNGGNIVFVADDNASTLLDFRFKRKYKAEDGKPGGAKRCSGKAAPDMIIKVPRGTLVKDGETGRIIADVSGNEPTVIAKGGRGGKGNMNFATPTRQTPRFAKPGHKGQALSLTLELKLLADVGLVGYPNVGKSSLISVVSAAKPQIADYHFTTLTPALGVVRAGEEDSFVMADIPGLIEGAAEGAGLGIHFLRHVERCRLIIHVVDVSESEGRDAKADFLMINRELSGFSPELAAKPQIVAANKIDIASDEQRANFRAFIEEQGLELFDISAATGAGTKELIFAAAKLLKTLPPVIIYRPEEPAPEPITESRAFEAYKESDGVFVVEADWLEHILRGVNVEDYESLQYFQRVLRSGGVIDALIAAGVEEGDTVCVGDFEFEFVE
jgi:GTP-binding protein